MSHPDYGPVQMGTSGPESGSIPLDPPTVGRARRADATRNRTRVLDAARRLVAERGLAAVTMDAIAEAAGVGKGTVYRAVEGRGRLAERLVDDAERTLQAAVLDGAPPLGPGAPPRARLHAFANAYLQLLQANTELLLETDRHMPGGRFATGAHAFWRTHLIGLATDLGCADPALTAELILALLAPDLQVQLQRHLRPFDVRAALVDAVDSLTREPGPDR